MVTYPETAPNAVLYVLKQLGTSDKRMLFSILYIADIKHLVSYGRLILEEEVYTKTNSGPIPSKINADFGSNVETVGNLLVSKSDPNMNYLSRSEVLCLDEAIGESKGLTFPELSDKTQGAAWAKASLDGSISVFDMALEGGADESVISYIKENLALHNAGW